ncbi:MAG: DUF4404 family protein [Verrucomicrobiae bacterium]|jgi:hypothetical protein|nr:DUF4404 family protein [Verrucomicrobiae bacterium]
MMQDTIARIEARLNRAEKMSDETRRDLLALLEELKAEVNGLADTHADEAQSIAGFAQVSAHEATRNEPNAAALGHSIGGLEASVAQFEQSHPGLVGVVNRVCHALSNLGI